MKVSLAGAFKILMVLNHNMLVLLTKFFVAIPTHLPPALIVTSILMNLKSPLVI